MSIAGSAHQFNNIGRRMLRGLVFLVSDHRNLHEQSSLITCGLALVSAATVAVDAWYARRSWLG
jgi:hypothetical protein